MASTLSDEKFMRRALELAERGRGFVEPNPLVGALVVRDGEIAGEGFHERLGAAHAEVNALAAAGEAARGATMVVTLEPCCHHGKTPPCADAIIAAGIARVVVAMVDPFESVRGQGVERLRAAGIAVDTGLCGDEARTLNAPFIRLVMAKLPYVHAKWAMTLDGKIATAAGESKWITSEAARRVAHELRGRMDAIVVGIGTVLADDPLLTALPPGPRTALRVVLDSRCRLPLTSHLARTASDLPVLVATSDQSPPAARDALRERGCELLVLPHNVRGVAIAALLGELGSRRLTNVLVEGGSEVLGSFFDFGMVNEIHAFIAPKLLGGTAARPAVGGFGRSSIADAVQFHIVETRRVGVDWLVRAVQNTD